MLISGSDLLLHTYAVVCRQLEAEIAAKAAIKKKGKRNAKLLSFDEEEEAEEEAPLKAKIRSYHDVVEDKRCSCHL